MNVINHFTSIYRDKQSLLTYLQTRLGYSNLVDPNPSNEYGYFIINSNIQFIQLNNFNLPVLQAQFDAFTEPDDFETELYPELLDNNETKLSLEDWIDDSGGQRWGTLTDNDLKAMELIEKYNKNVLLLRSTKKTRLVNEIDVNSDSQPVSLFGVETQLQNLNDKLVTRTIDNELKNITDVVALDPGKQVVVGVIEKAPYNPLIDDTDIF